MGLPFTHDQFLDVFAAFNARLWPVAALLWLLTLAALALLAAGRLRPRLAGGLLVAHWSCSAVYHLAFFAAINPAARLFGGLFLLQALLLLWYGVWRAELLASWGRQRHQVLSAVLCVYALAYPLLVLATGLRWPRMPAFGVPCPTALLTVGALLGLEPRRLRGLAVIPLIWCVIAGSAALALDIRPDLMLWVGGALLVWYAAAPRTLAEPDAG